MISPRTSHALRSASRTELAPLAVVLLAALALFIAKREMSFTVSLYALILLVVAALTVAGQRHLRRTLTEYRLSHAELEQRFWQVEADGRLSRAQLHEVNATLAGISSASRLIRDGLTTEERRRRLEQMMDDELARLGRLLAGQAEARTGPAAVAVDDLLATLATAHEARGHQVRWDRSDAVLLGRRDDVQEVLNILLDNAAKHGAGTVTVATTAIADRVEIAVSDQGAGIAPGVDVFAWGQRGPRSAGQGIGLHIARELMEQQGGYLRVRPTTGPGATFVLGLPAAKERVRDAGRHHV